MPFPNSHHLLNSVTKSLVGMLSGIVVARGQLDPDALVTEYLPAIGAHRFGIVKLFDLSVHHMLMAKSGVKTTDIRTIVSQNQALRQCRMYLKRVWPHTEIREYEDTAKAAEDLALGVLPPDCAVIASRAAAKTHKLTILEESVQDLKFNVTTFIIAKRLKA